VALWTIWNIHDPTRLSKKINTAASFQALKRKINWLFDPYALIQPRKRSVEHSVKANTKQNKEIVWVKNSSQTDVSREKSSWWEEERKGLIVSK
jgi:hypothetical protein